MICRKYPKEGKKERKKPTAMRRPLELQPLLLRGATALVEEQGDPHVVDAGGQALGVVVGVRVAEREAAGLRAHLQRGALLEQVEVEQVEGEAHHLVLVGEGGVAARRVHLS